MIGHYELATAVSHSGPILSPKYFLLHGLTKLTVWHRPGEDVHVLCLILMQVTYSLCLINGYAW